MRGPAALYGPALRRWRFPDLDPPPEADEGAAPVAPEHLDPPRQEPPAADIAEVTPGERQRALEEAARGYEDGLRRGLADGRAQGREEGFAAGEAAGRQSLAEEAGRLAAIAERMAAPVPAVERAVEDAVVGLALELARCVIGSETTLSRESLVRLIRGALAAAPVRLDGLRIALNPDDLDLIRALAPDFESGGAALVGDPSVETGGCLIGLDGEAGPVKDRRWYVRAADAGPQIDLSLAARWRSAMLALFDGEGA